MQEFLHSNKKACITVSPAILEEIFKESNQEGHLNCAREMNHTVRRFHLGMNLVMLICCVFTKANLRANGSIFVNTDVKKTFALLVLIS